MPPLAKFARTGKECACRPFEREREVLELRFGLIDGTDHTLEKSASISRSRDASGGSKPKPCENYATQPAAASRDYLSQMSTFLALTWSG
jgi:hypothetical protein